MLGFSRINRIETVSAALSSLAPFRHFFGFANRCLVYLWVRDLVYDRYIIGVADERI